MVRKVTVTNSGDTTAPVIVLLGDPEITLEAGNTYTTPVRLHLMTEMESSQIKSLRPPVDPSKLGEYTITYNVSDEADNAATQVTRKVTVVDTTAPVIILNGDSEIDFALGSEYTDAGATVSDNLDTDLELVVENSVDASAVGVYQVKFNITDSTGNKATEVVRT